MSRSAAGLPARVARGLRLARVLLSSQYALMLEYRAETALWALSNLLPFIMLGLWSGAEATAAAGVDRLQLARYFLAAFVVRQFTVVWVIYSFEEDNLQGRLAPYLLQPLLPVWRYVSAHLAEQVTRLPFVAVIVALFFLLDPAALWIPSPLVLLQTLLAIWLAFAVNFLLQHAIALLCFWSERASALERLLSIPFLFLSGLVAPLQLFPEPVRSAALWTPFPYMVDVPARILAGAAVNQPASFAAMVGWIALLLPLNAWLWRAGVRRYAAMGA
jgi:ABC-2 type transport system permease protein